MFLKFFQSFELKENFDACKCIIKFLTRLNIKDIYGFLAEKHWNYWKNWCMHAHNFNFKWQFNPSDLSRFTVRFTKLLINRFRGSLEIPEVRYEFNNFIMWLSIKSWTSKWSCEFHTKFHWEVVNFVASEVRVIRCSWLAICKLQMNLNNFSTKQGLFMIFTSEM